MLSSTKILQKKGLDPRNQPHYVNTQSGQSCIHGPSGDIKYTATVHTHHAIHLWLDKRDLPALARIPILIQQLLYDHLDGVRAHIEAPSQAARRVILCYFA